MNIAKHTLMVMAIFGYWLFLSNRIFLFFLVPIWIISILIGLYTSRKEDESAEEYMWRSFVAGANASSLFAMIMFGIIIAFDMLPDMASLASSAEAFNWIEALLASFFRFLLIGPSILNSYRAYNDWRTASKNRDVRKSKEVVLDGETWEIPEILIEEEANVIEAQN